MNYTQEQFEHYRRQWQDSRKSVEFMAGQLGLMGYETKIMQQEFAPNRHEMHRYFDDGDLMVRQDGDPFAEWSRVEVKQILTHDFTGPDDWRFGPKFFVTDVKPFDAADPRPLAYTYPNKSMTHWAIINVEQTFPYWATAEVYQHYRQKTYTKYWCPTDLVMFTPAITTD